MNKQLTNQPAIELCKPSSEGIITLGGHKMICTAPQSRDVCITDIAHSLALQNRFLGHTKQPYSVAQHSLNCLLAARTFYSEYNEDHEWCLQVLLHDAAEAYIGDIVTPVKKILYAGVYVGAVLASLSPSYDPDGVLHSALTMEQRVIDAIANAFRLKPLEPEQRALLEKIDSQMCATESMHLCFDVVPPDVKMFMMPAKFFAERPYAEVEQEFLATFRELISYRG